MRRETTEQQEWRAHRVQPSGRPFGAPSGLDAQKSVCERQPQAKRTATEQPFQTPNHNLIPTKTGPTIGVHFTLTQCGRCLNEPVFKPRMDTNEHEFRSRSMFTLRVKQRGGASCSDSCPFVSIRGFICFFQVKTNRFFQVHAFRGQKKEAGLSSGLREVIS